MRTSPSANANRSKGVSSRDGRNDIRISKVAQKNSVFMKNEMCVRRETTSCQKKRKGRERGRYQGDIDS
jgi:hypothetical protein